MRKIANTVIWIGVGLVTMILMQSRHTRRKALSRRDRLKAAYRQAGRDPAYRAEMDRIDRAFDHTAGDGLESE
jgi:hypothetical protein